ncbi:MAG: BON domain-containing protein [Porphyromonadaceae bacterium]|nr:BON domain-containing protein [Porphyromonadaceae bacterium]
MKKNQIVSMLALILLLAVGVTSCKPKDADIQKAVQTAIAANPDAVGVTATVEKGVVTLTGEVKDESTSMAINGLAAGVKDVKSVVNDLTIAAPLVNAVDSALQTALVDALKDHPGVSATVLDGVVTLTGEISQSDLATLMQKVSALKPVKIDNQLTIK